MNGIMIGGKGEKTKWVVAVTLLLWRTTFLEGATGIENPLLVPVSTSLLRTQHVVRRVQDVYLLWSVRGVYYHGRRGGHFRVQMSLDNY